MSHDALNIGVLGLQRLLYPVRELDVWIPAQLAKHRSAFHRLVCNRIQFSEQCYATDLAHGDIPVWRIEGKEPSCGDIVHLMSCTREPGEMMGSCARGAAER